MEDAGVLKEQRKGKARSSRRGLIGLVVVKRARSPFRCKPVVRKEASTVSQNARSG